MDFFEAQEAARRRTHVLVALFAAAVVAIIAVVYAILYVAMGPRVLGIDWLLLLQVAIGVCLVIAVGSAARTASLRQGGPAVAELIGARRVAPDTTDLDERRFVNVVEEMSIASGTPVPAIYVLDREEGINAFAAGYATHDAAVAVTGGALRSLNRDELQGVVAHEFSHILNGDMRLNIRLIGILYGILLLAIIGRGILYAGPRGGRGRGKDGAGWIVLLGLALLLVGYIGVFFGRMIQAAVSRQREYLADSAAVQFTRNPGGLAGALKKIGARPRGSRIENHHAAELSHLFFANGVGASLAGFLATHPPLEDRIRRLEPEWDGDFGAVLERGTPAHAELAGGSTRRSELEAHPGLAAAVQLEGPAALVASVGAPTPHHLAYAAALLGRFPEPLTRAAHDPDRARALVFALVLAWRHVDERARRLITECCGAAVEAELDALLPLVEAQGTNARLALVDIALPALQQLPYAAAQRFRDAVEQLIASAGGVRMFEYALNHTLARRLPGPDEGGDPRARSIRSLEPLRADVETLLSAVAWAGSRGDPGVAAAAFEAGARRLPSTAGPLRLQDARAAELQRVDRSLAALERASPAIQRLFLEACAESAAHDRHLDTAEAELLRAIAEALDCPMPPVLAGESA